MSLDTDAVKNLLMLRLAMVDTAMDTNMEVFGHGYGLGYGYYR